jgi:LysM repeat protein
MDTISRDTNETNYLPIAALIVGLLAAIFAGVAFFKVNAVAKSMQGQAALNARVNDLESQLRTTAATADKATERITRVASDTQKAFTEVGQAIGGMRNDLAQVQESLTRPAPTPSAAAATSGGSGAPTAGPGEYVVKSGDTGARIARDAGIGLGDLMAANPGLDWNRLRVGQVIKLPRGR